MTPTALFAAQAALHAQIQARAIELSHDPANVQPIYDGVVDAEAYLASKPKVMWILKEPYDDFDTEGMPAGGGWTMFKDFGEGDTLAKAVNRNAAMREPGSSARSFKARAHGDARRGRCRCPPLAR